MTEPMEMTEAGKEPFADSPDVAVIGLAGRFPGASNVAELWSNLLLGREAVRFFGDDELARAGVPAELRNDPRYVPARGYLEGAEDFDAAYFDVTPRDARAMDPQHRQFLECCVEALEDAGVDPERELGRIGVFAGCGKPTYLLSNLMKRPELLDGLGDMGVGIGNEADFLATKVAYKLGLEGPALNVQTACSTSLVAVHLAVQALLHHECDIALAGGVSIRFPQAAGYVYQEGGIGSPDGHCRPFDAGASGTLGGNGLGVVVLRRIGDAREGRHRVYAVIRGSAVNNDGKRKLGFTAPSVDGQAEVIVEALAAADVDPDSVSFVEAHGTGTALGDPIEVDALTRAFRMSSSRVGYCHLGSVKSNLGHLDAAAGVTGLIKVALSLVHERIPPTLHFRRPNPHLHLDTSPFLVNAEVEGWPRTEQPRRATVSGFGIGGTNALVVLEEAPRDTREPHASSPHILPLSARTPTALVTSSRRLADTLEGASPRLDDVAFTLAVGRRGLACRRAVVASDRAQAAALLRQPIQASSPARQAKPPRPVFLLPGQGSQHPRMASACYRRFASYRIAFDRCAQALRDRGGPDVAAVLLAPELEAESHRSALRRTELTQPALFAVEYALAQVLLDAGVAPAALLGHSLGELVAAAIAGVLTLEDAAQLVCTRARVMQDSAPGAMLAVGLAPQELEPRLPQGARLAAINAPELCVVAGPQPALETWRQGLRDAGVFARPLSVSHAFHSPAMQPAAEAVVRLLRGVPLSAPRVPFLSNLTGSYITDAQATDPEYWGQQLLAPVQCSRGLQTVLADGHGVFLEVGPGRTLTGLLRMHAAHPSKGAPLQARSLLGPEGDVEPLLEAVAELWSAGLELDLGAFLGGADARRVSLPTYPFEHRRFDLADGTDGSRAPSQPACAPGVSSEAAPNPDERGRAADASPLGWATARFAELLGETAIDPDRDFFEAGGSSLAALQLLAALRDERGVEVGLSEFSSAATPRALAHRIEASGRVGAEGNAIVSRANASGRGTPLVLVHPVGGQVLCYARLAHALGSSQPLVSLRARGMEPGETPLANIEAMARLYIESLPEDVSGPAFLGGWSFGGVVAFEMARQLCALGRPAPVLILLDSPAPLRTAAPGDTDAVHVTWFLRDLLSGRTPDLPPGVLEALEACEQIEPALELCRRHGLLPADIDDAPLQRAYSVFRNNLIALSRYLPLTLPDPIPTVLLRAQLEGSRAPEGLDFSPDAARWSELIGAPVNVRTVAGDHYTLLQPPHLASLAETVLNVMRSAGKVPK